MGEEASEHSEPEGKCNLDGVRLKDRDYFLLFHRKLYSTYDTS